MNETPGSTARGSLEALIWRLTGWKLDQSTVEEMMGAVDDYTLNMVSAAGRGEAQWLKPVALKVTDLPSAELEKLDAQLEAARSDAMAAGRSEGYQQGWNEGVAQGRGEALPQTRSVLPRGVAPGKVLQAGDGALWLALGMPEPEVMKAYDVPARPSARTVTVSGTSQLQADQRKCRTCHEVKPLDKFYRDAKGSQGRKTQCGDCDAAAKRDRNARKAQKV